MAIVRLYALRRLAKGQQPRRYSFSDVMIYLEDYYLNELNFDREIWNDDSDFENQKSFSKSEMIVSFHVVHS